MRLLVVQYAGDYLEAFRNLCEHNIETYHAHRYVIESMTGLGREIGEAVLMCCRTSERYDVVLPSRLRVMGAAAHPYRETDKVVEVIRLRTDPYRRPRAHVGPVEVVRPAQHQDIGAFRRFLPGKRRQAATAQLYAGEDAQRPPHRLGR
jgi:hypothetical protein